jgi:hypothetical protein
MKRFYLAIPVEYEDVALRKIVELGSVQLTRDIPVESGEKNDVLDVCKRFARLYGRLEHAAAKVADEPEPAGNLWVSFDIIREFVGRAESSARAKIYKIPDI